MSAVCPSLRVGDGGDDLARQRVVLQDDGVQVAAQRRFDRRNEFLIDFDQRSERAGQRRQDALRIIESVQNRLRTFGQSFALGVELLQNLEARLPFRERAVARDQRRFGFAQLLLLPGSSSSATGICAAKSWSASVFLGGSARIAAELLRDSVAAPGSFT